MKHVVSAACGLWLACAGWAQAQVSVDRMTSPVVVELYTSQGCSSCPPADAILGRLSSDPRVIALALHVDYWDYLGWKDVFARAEHTKRQKDYARAAGRKMVFTPQMIVNGQDSVVGNDAGAVEETIRRHAATRTKGPDIRLTVTREGGQIVIRAEAVPPSDRAYRVQLVRYQPRDTVEIGRGENAGHTVEYFNIVTSWQTLGEWRAGKPVVMTASAPGPDRTVIVVQDERMGAVMAAAELR
ncbi:MAG: DUF1223 domain-containing protein [Gemmobacter sp.]